MHRRLFLPAAAVVFLAAGAFAQLSPEARQIASRLTANSLKADVSFLASDALQGRGTPSAGLDIAAEYIAAQFRRAGLEPVGDDGYFQTANWVFSERDMTGFTLKLATLKQAVKVASNQVTFTLNQGLKLGPTAVIKVDFK